MNDASTSAAVAHSVLGKTLMQCLALVEANNLPAAQAYFQAQVSPLLSQRPNSEQDSFLETPLSQAELAVLLQVVNKTQGLVAQEQQLLMRRLQVLRKQKAGQQAYQETDRLAGTVTV